MHARADACFPLNASWAAATAPGAVMYFQSKGLLRDSQSSQTLLPRWKGVHAVTVWDDVVFQEKKTRGTIKSWSERLEWDYQTITWHNKWSESAGRGPDAAKWEAFGWHFPLTPSMRRDTMHVGPHTAQGNVITLAARSKPHSPALLCMNSLSAAHAGTAARLHQISYSVCEVTAWLTATLNHLEKNINIIASIASFLLPLPFPRFFPSLHVHQDEKVKQRNWELPYCLPSRAIPEPDDLIGQRTVREQKQLC